MSEFCVRLNLQRVENPVPHISSGGDCGPCGVACILSWPAERLMDLYAMTEEGKPSGGLDVIGLRRLLLRLQSEGIIEDFTDEPILPRVTHYFPGPLGYPAEHLEHEWFSNLRLHLEAGYAGITAIDFKGSSQYSTDSEGQARTNPGDHWVVLAGAKAVWEAVEEVPGARRLMNYIRVICSAVSGRKDYWIEAREFLRKHGGFRVMFVRPREVNRS